MSACSRVSMCDYDGQQANSNCCLLRHRLTFLQLVLGTSQILASRPFVLTQLCLSPEPQKSAGLVV